MPMLDLSPKFIVKISPAVTIIIINHNYATYLAQAIQSALAQTGPAPEIIVVDDGSTDHSASVIERFGTAITPIFKPAGGHVSAVNAGFAVSHGDIVIFLDADDALYPNCLQTIARHWREGDTKLQYRLDTIDGHGRNQNMTFPHFPADLTPEAIKIQSCRFGIYPWSVSSGNAFARSFVAALLPIDKDEIYRSPDGYLSKMAPLFGRVRSVPDVLAAYRVHGANGWAQAGGGFKIDTIIRWLKFDLVLQRRFVAIAANRSIPVSAHGNEDHTQHLEHRLIARRFAASQTPYAPDNLGVLCLKSIRAACHAPNMRAAGRLIWAAWFVYLCIMPRWIIEPMLKRGRLQTGRSLILQIIVRVARGRISH